MNQQVILENPTVDKLFQRLVDSYGFHDAEQIPIKVVHEMFVSFFNYEHKWNDTLQKLLDEYNRLSIKPITISKNEVSNGL